MSIQYTAPPTIASFMKSDAFGRIIAGPVGSGKTTGAVIECLRRCIEQKPGGDSYRHTRFAIVRQTLKQLKDTVLKDCQSWLGGLGRWKPSENTFILDFDDVRSEWIFIPLENAEDQARLLSMQLTGAWLSECIEMNVDVIAPISGRLGRYPSGALGAPTWHGMIADTNMPTEMTAWHTFMENLPSDWQKFVQPSGLAWNAENLNWLLQTEETLKLPVDHPRRLAQGRKYYERFVEMYGEDSDWVKRYVKAEYGDDPSGSAVFRASFKSDFHLSTKQFNLIPGYPVLIGQDFGRNPWSLIAQADHMGRLVVHEEIPARNIGLEKHVTEHLLPRLRQDKYVGYKIAVIGDPAGSAKDSIGEENNFDVLKRLGLPAIQAPTNTLDPRLRAVEALLGRQVGGGPALIINAEKCPVLSRAMAGGYRFKKLKGGGEKAVPEKDDPEGFSHVADCLQYLALAVHGNMGEYIASRINNRPRRPRKDIKATGWT